MITEELKQNIREVILDRYGADISEAIFRFSTQNFAFIFPKRSHMIRVSMSPKKTRAEILSELMWIDDLKPFKQTICEPNTSLNGRLLEEFEIDGVSYRASMFRKARGDIKATMDMSPMFFICVGDLLGTIHAVSTNERELGIKYKRKSMTETFAEYKDRAFGNLSDDIKKRILDIEEKVNALPQDIGTYGICHGDFHTNNFFVEENNIWLFDFDGCAYANYLYDVASFMQGCLLFGYKSGKDRRKTLYEDMLPYFKIGYELNKKCGEHYWDNFDLLFTYRAVFTFLALAQINECGVTDDFNKIKQFYSFIIMQDDIFDAMTKAGQNSETSVVG